MIFARVHNTLFQKFGVVGQSQMSIFIGEPQDLLQQVLVDSVTDIDKLFIIGDRTPLATRRLVQTFIGQHQEGVREHLRGVTFFAGPVPEVVNVEQSFAIRLDDGLSVENGHVGDGDESRRRQIEQYRGQLGDDEDRNIFAAAIDESVVRHDVDERARTPHITRAGRDELVAIKKVGASRIDVAGAAILPGAISKSGLDA
mmetsp:Transcript_6597/g.14369  ORF Transcript_6597/g.14369 Transcript_6597/m.14369 type:complete len:200 (-) Transcript_6597:75-674(-)